MIDVDAAMAYSTFVEARHAAYEARQRGEKPPWTDEPIVASHKFTNVFRILDFGSQFVVTDLIDSELEPEDQLMRLFLYRHTGRVEVWRWMLADLGEYPTRANLWMALGSMKSYREKTGRSIFTSAYLVYPQSSVKGTDKLESIFDLTSRLFVSGKRTAYDFLNGTNQTDRFQALRTNKGVADFMSMQILTDWGYTPHCGRDLENDFVVLGPGARKGALALDPTGDPNQTFTFARNLVSDLDVFLHVEGKRYRTPSWMDVQNTLCEFSKWVRFAQKPLAGPYVPAHPGPQPDPVLPEHWR